jgi:hypothetical protein
VQLLQLFRIQTRLTRSRSVSKSNAQSCHQAAEFRGKSTQRDQQSGHGHWHCRRQRERQVHQAVAGASAVNEWIDCESMPSDETFYKRDALPTCLEPTSPALKGSISLHP